MKKYKYYLTAVMIIVLDQLSKLYIRSHLSPGDTIFLTPKLIWITYVRNAGASFSISLGASNLNRIMFSLVTIIASIVLVIIIQRSSKRTEMTGFSLILGGALGNLIDRLWLGRVTDFINCDFPDIFMERWPVFNLADSSIVIGVSLLVLYYLIFEKRNSETVVMLKEKT